MTDCPRCFIENKPCARHCDPVTCPDPAHDAGCPIGAVPPETAVRRGCAPWDFHDGPGCEVHGPGPIPPAEKEES